MFRETLLISVTRYHSQKPASEPTEQDKRYLENLLGQVFNQELVAGAVKIEDYTLQQVK